MSRLGQAPTPAEHGSFLPPSSVAGRSIVRVESGISGLGSVLLAFGGTSAGSPLDTGYITSSVTVTDGAGHLVNFDDVFPQEFGNIFLNSSGESFTKEIYSGSALTDDEKRVMTGRYKPYTPFTGKSSSVVYGFHNFDIGVAQTVYMRSFWKIIPTVGGG